MIRVKIGGLGKGTDVKEEEGEVCQFSDASCAVMHMLFSENALSRQNMILTLLSVNP